MKQLKSTSSDLRRLYEESITVKYIGESLQSVGGDQDTILIKKWMSEQNFDILGIEENGVVCGYIERENLGEGLCSQYQKIFHPSELIAASTPLMQILPFLREKSRLFILETNRINGIVTCGDLQKAPVRMLLFGLITLLEMNLLRLIRLYFPNNQWEDFLKPERVMMAKRLWEIERDKNQALDLSDYLQFCDKRDIILTSPELIDRLELSSKRGAERLLKSAEFLRNKLAHAQDLVNGSSWSEIISLTEEIERLLRQCEEI